MAESFDTPIVFIVFNRPDLAARVLERIASIRPRTLLVIADGPRATHPEDADLCTRTRALLEGVDWPCEVVRDFADENLGCGRRISSGLDRVFAELDRAIVLEDDCLPDPSFFRFCEELLERYADRPEVMNITGEYDSRIRPPGDESYFFTSLPRIWGWATWRRAWQGYDYAISDFRSVEPRMRERLRGYYKNGSPLCRRMEKVVERRIDTWDYQWWYHVFKHEGLCINPRVNLVSNLGFDERATHKAEERGGSRHVGSEAMRFPLVHPERCALDPRTDRRFFFERFGRPLHKRVGSALRRIWPL